MTNVLDITRMLGAKPSPMATEENPYYPDPVIYAASMFNQSRILALAKATGWRDQYQEQLAKTLHEAKELLAPILARNEAAQRWRIPLFLTNQEQNNLMRIQGLQFPKPKPPQFSPQSQSKKKLTMEEELELLKKLADHFTLTMQQQAQQLNNNFVPPTPSPFGG